MASHATVAGAGVVPVLAGARGRAATRSSAVKVNAARGAVAASDVPVGTGRVYTPGTADLGRVLAVTATPVPPRGDDAPCGAPASFATARATAAARARPNASKRMAQFVAEGPDASTASADPSATRIMTYNVLSDAYAHTWASLYPYLSAAAADPRARLPLAMQDILLASPEIVALQEVRGVLGYLQRHKIELRAGPDTHKSKNP